MRGRKSKTIDDYKKLAQQKNLIFIAEESPRRTTFTTSWRCKRCNKVMEKSYQSVQRNPGCICKNMALPEKKYMEVAEKLGIEWRGKFVPPNTKTKTLWYSVTNNVLFSAAYRDLGYSRIPKSLERYVLA